MQIDTFASRLQKALDKRNLKPIELANKTGLDKSLISNYLSGKYKAKQDKLTIIAKVLDVNEVWLMGYDVPLDSDWAGAVHDDEEEKFIFKFNDKEMQKEEPNEVLNEHYKALFDKDGRLTEEQKEFFMDMIERQHKKFDEAQEKGNVN